MLNTIPNWITIARVLSVPLVMYLILSESFIGRILAVVLFFLAAVSDAVDGYIARSYKQTSVFGQFADPIADKLLISGALIALVQLGELTAAVVMALIAREFLVTGLRIVAIHEGQIISASVLGKLKTISHVVLVLIILAARTFSFGPAGDIVKIVALVLAVAMSFISGGEYFYRSRRLFV
jgi:CDP-diacylglycerol---glycerol-3-phosphate 3-phosphatidyltransferase